MLGAVLPEGTGIGIVALNGNVIPRFISLQDLLCICDVVLNEGELFIHRLRDISHHEEFINLNITMTDIAGVNAN